MSKWEKAKIINKYLSADSLNEIVEKVRSLHKHIFADLDLDGKSKNEIIRLKRERLLENAIPYDQRFEQVYQAVIFSKKRVPSICHDITYTTYLLLKERGYSPKLVFANTKYFTRPELFNIDRPVKHSLLKVNGKYVDPSLKKENSGLDPTDIPESQLNFIKEIEEEEFLNSYKTLIENFG